MKITDIECKFVDRYLFVLVHTDSGVTGLGESGSWAFLEASAEAVKTFKRYLIGQDPLRIEHHWNYLYRAFHFRGAAIMGALSAVDIALWDIAGKRHGVPCHELLGGKTRDKARVYCHVYGNNREELVQGCRDAKARGFTAVGHLTPFNDTPREERQPAISNSKYIGDAIDSVYAYRDAVGDDVDLCVEIHRRLSIADAITLGRAIEGARPYFYEDPVRPDNFDDMARVQAAIGIPIATGERLHTLQEFGMLLRRDACRFVRPDVCMCGGISGAKKIAALAEAYGVQVIPHNPLSPVSTAACIQIAACIPNFAIQELPIGEDAPPKSVMMTTSLAVGKGCIIVPDAPGIGVAIAPDAEKLCPYVPREYVAKLHDDGSVFDV